MRDDQASYTRVDYRCRLRMKKISPSISNRLQLESIRRLVSSSLVVLVRNIQSAFRDVLAVDC